MSVAHLKPVRAVALRATLLDDCGVPVNTATVYNSQIATKQFISLSFSPDVEEGEAFRLKNADGSLCINDNSDGDKLLGLNVTLQMCGLPMHFTELLLGGALLTNAQGTIVGGVLPPTNFAEVADAASNRVLIEVWSRNSDKSACEGGNAFNYIRWFLPMTLKWQVSGDTAFANDILQFELQGYVEANTNFNKPVAVDPDLDADMIDAIREGGPLAWVATNTLPTLVEANYTNPAPSAPVNTSLPVISGTAKVGETLTTTNGTWNGHPAPTYTYQWEDDGVVISGATAQSFTLTSTQQGGVITVVVTATNASGTASAESAGTAAVAA